MQRCVRFPCILGGQELLNVQARSYRKVRCTSRDHNGRPIIISASSFLIKTEAK